MSYFLYDKLEIIDKIYLERALRVRRRKIANANSNNIPRAIAAKLLDYKKGRNDATVL